MTAASSLPDALLRALTGRFALPGAALVLWGSHARGDAGPYSDVDLMRFTEDGGPSPPGESHLVLGRLVTVGTAGFEQAASWLERPETAVLCVCALRHARPLSDPQARFAALRERAQAFTWTSARSHRADLWVGAQMAGWAEEALKGLEGLRRDDPGRLLAARFGLSWGLSRVMVVHERLLLDSEDAMHAALAERLGAASRWMRLRHVAFGLPVEGAATGLAGQVRAGLRLYRDTAERVAPLFDDAQRALVAAVTRAISDELG